jgi:hypothetical protein
MKFRTKIYISHAWVRKVKDLDPFPEISNSGSGSGFLSGKIRCTCLRSSLSSASQPEIVEMGLWLLSTGSNHRKNN